MVDITDLYFNETVRVFNDMLISQGDKKVRLVRKDSLLFDGSGGISSGTSVLYSVWKPVVGWTIQSDNWSGDLVIVQVAAITDLDGDVMYYKSNC